MREEMSLICASVRVASRLCSEIFTSREYFPVGNIFAAEEVGGFDGSDFRNIQRRDGLGDVGKARGVGEQQGEIALDGGKTRDGLVAAGIFDAVVGAIERAEIYFG